MSWVDAGPVDGIPSRGARVLRAGEEAIAVFRTGDGRLFALRDRCPHRGGPLSQGIVHGARVTCPLHEWVIDLASGEATGADVGCTLTFRVRTEQGRVLVEVPNASTVAGEAAPTALPMSCGSSVSRDPPRAE